LTTNTRRLSGLVGILPFVEQQALWEQISNPWKSPTTAGTAPDYPAMGPTPGQNDGAPAGGALVYAPWLTQVEAYRCPSDPVRLGGVAQTNYAFSYGDGTRHVGANFQGGTAWGTPAPDVDPGSKRGVFTRNYQFGFRDILDGTANTIAMGEIGVGTDGTGGREVWAHNVNVNSAHNPPSLCRTGAHISATNPTTYATGLPDYFSRGRRWADGHISFTGITTVLPPNSPSCRAPNGGILSGVFSAGSYHQGGCHVLMADGAVRFVTSSIEAGDATLGPVSSLGPSWGYRPAGSPSPYGLWGALGSRGAKETQTLE
jgi:prepilin-type processing-associated H-X9-DG protein